MGKTQMLSLFGCPTRFEAVAHFLLDFVYTQPGIKENIKYFLRCKNDNFALLREYPVLLNCSYPKEHSITTS